MRTTSKSARYRNVKTTFTPAERARYKAEAQRIDRDEKQAIIAQAKRFAAQVQMLRNVLAELKAERERQGLSLGEVSRRSGIDKAALSRLENAANVNPKLETLVRYAEVLGVELRMTVTGG